LFLRGFTEHTYPPLGPPETPACGHFENALPIEKAGK
jgi:hypothetical protein